MPFTTHLAADFPRIAEYTLNKIQKKLLEDMAERGMSPVDFYALTVEAYSYLPTFLKKRAEDWGFEPRENMILTHVTYSIWKRQ